MKKAPASLELRWVSVNGQPGLLAIVNGQAVQVIAFDIVDGRIATCFVVRNPEKLARVGVTGIRPDPQDQPGAKETAADTA